MMNSFFFDHTYFIWENLLDIETCQIMTNEVKNAYDQHYVEKPKLYDSLLQKNTNHIEKQGYSRKYKAIYGDDVKNLTPSIYEYYTNENVINMLSDVAGCQLHIVPTHKTVDQAVQIYNEKGDGTNWHHDRSIFNGGRAFTFLTVIHNTSDQQLTIWTEKHGIEKIQWSVGKAVLIEKFVTYHSVTPLHSGERILLTLTYCEKPYSPCMLRPVEYIMNKSKNFGYMGFDAFTVNDYIVGIIVVFIVLIVASVASVFIVLIVLIVKKRSIKHSNKYNKYLKK